VTDSFSSAKGRSVPDLRPFFVFLERWQVVNQLQVESSKLKSA